LPLLQIVLDPYFEKKAKDLKIDAYVMKPILIGEIAKTIREVIRNSTAN
jgi:hypothetical protein